MAAKTIAIRPLHRVLITIDDAGARRRPGAAVTVTKRRGACYIVGQLVRTQPSSSTPRYLFRSGVAQWGSRQRSRRNHPGVIINPFSQHIAPCARACLFQWHRKFCGTVFVVPVYPIPKILGDTAAFVAFLGRTRGLRGKVGLVKGQ